jgi:hypothetical protein
MIRRGDNMFAIDRDNRIYYGEPRRDGDNRFADLSGLTLIAVLREWSKQTVTDIWNWLVKDLNLAGIEHSLKPQKCFRNRPYGLAKLWDAIQRLVPSDAPSEAERAPDAILKDGMEEEKPVRKPKKKRDTKARKPAVAKGSTKRDEVIRLISRQNGASLDELVEKMGWERHTLRGLLSTLASKQGLKIESTKHETKGRVYRLVASLHSKRWQRMALGSGQRPRISMRCLTQNSIST